MKQFLLFLFLLPLTLWANKTDDANKAVVKVTTFNHKGEVIAHSQGYFCAPAGNVVAPYQLFKGATRAEITDWRGNKSQVMRIVGASSVCDLVVCTTNASPKKVEFLQTATMPTERGTMGLLQTYYTTNKKDKAEATAIATVEKFERFNYYTLTTPNDERYFGAPVVNAQGEAIGVVQKNMLKNATTACAIDPMAADSLRVTSISAFNADLNAILIAKQLPQDEKEAYSYLYMVARSSQDSIIIATVLQDFMAAFPKNTAVYGDAATFYAARNNYMQAEQYLQEGMRRGGEHLASLYDTQSGLMFLKTTKPGKDLYPAWNLETALAAAQKAYEISPQPSYLMQQGVLLYHLQRDKEAFAKFQLVNQSPIASSQSFLFAANALGRAGGDTLAIITLLDSALARCPQPYTQEAITPLYSRAAYLNGVGEYRKAVADYNAYEKVVGAHNLAGYFYYVRSQAEIAGKLYQQAIDDLTTATVRAKTDAEREAYNEEKAALYVRVAMWDEAITVATDLLRSNSQNVYAHKLLGIAFGEKKQKAKALEHLNFAKSHGDATVEPLIKKYK